MPPAPEGWAFDLGTAIAVKLRGYCDPHQDAYAGGREVASHRSFFWLISDTSRRTSKLIAEAESREMSPGDWAIFDDSKMHAFLADGTWIGVAVQMVPAGS